jgi:hypothetical protein
MAERVGGESFAFLIGGSAVAVMRTCEFTEESINVDDTASGDLSDGKHHLRKKYTVEAEGELEATSPYAMPSGLTGTTTTWGLKTLSSYSNNIVSGTGLFTRFRIRTAYDQMFTIGVTIESNKTVAVYSLTAG